MTEPDHVVNNPGEPPSNLVTWEIVPMRGTRRRRLIVIASAMLLVVAVVVIVAVSLASLRRQDFALPASPIGYGSAAPTQSVPSRTSTPTPTPFTTPPRSPQPSRSPADKAPRVIMGHINFEHFTVAISRIDVDGARAVRVTAKVCVRSLPQPAREPNADQLGSMENSYGESHDSRAAIGRPPIDQGDVSSGPDVQEGPVRIRMDTLRSLCG